VGDAPRRSNVDIEALLIQFLALGVATAGLVFACRDE
jgi:hypothetical protein